MKDRTFKQNIALLASTGLTLMVLSALLLLEGSKRFTIEPGNTWAGMIFMISFCAAWCSGRYLWVNRKEDEPLQL